MPRETIASVRKALNAKVREERDVHECRMEALRRDHAEVVKKYIDHNADLIQRNQRQAERLDQQAASHSEQVEAAHANTRDVLAIAHERATALEASKQTIADLQNALTSAANVIAQLSCRPEA